MRRRNDRPPGTGSTRHVPLLLPILAAAFLAIRLVLAFFAGPEPGAATAAEDGPGTVHWTSADSAEDLSRQSGRPILYDFAAEWCGPCKMMNRELFSSAAAASYINATFVPVRVLDRAVEEGSNPPLTDALQKRYRIKAFPTLVVAGTDGESSLLEGYAGRKSVLDWLKEAGRGK